MDSTGLIFALGWVKGPWRAVPVLQSCDVSCTSRWQSPGELPYLSDKDGSPLRGACVLNHPSLGFLKGLVDEKKWSSNIQWNLEMFNLRWPTAFSGRALSYDKNCFVLNCPIPEGSPGKLNLYKFQEKDWESFTSDCTYGVFDTLDSPCEYVSLFSRSKEIRR